MLPVLGRTLEKLVSKQFYSYCEDNKIIPQEQFGFRKFSNCEVALLTATDSWLQAVDSGMFVGSLLLDLTKAFDTVSHVKLIDDLLKIGCSQSVLLWFTNYLSNRQQRVVQQGSYSMWCPVTRGVPQGSCLSPLLFSIYMRELPSCCTSSTIQFADDTTARRTRSFSRKYR